MSHPVNLPKNTIWRLQYYVNTTILGCSIVQSHPYIHIIQCIVRTYTLCEQGVLIIHIPEVGGGFIIVGDVTVVVGATVSVPVRERSLHLYTYMQNTSKKSY